MIRAFTLSAFLVFASALAFAETFNGKLVDAACVQQKGGACTPTESTASFGLQVSGKLLTLDAEGNRKAAEAMKESGASADRQKDANAHNVDVMAKVDGTLNGDEIKVDTIKIQ
jgi:hypothetical protein